jgi:hypothetical protein
MKAFDLKRRRAAESDRGAELLGRRRRHDAEVELAVTGKRVEFGERRVPASEHR